MGTIPLAVCQSYRNTAMIKTAAVLLLVVLLGPTETQGEDVLAFKNSQNGHCECECPTPGDNKCLCDCACPRPGASCGPLLMETAPRPTCHSAQKTSCLLAELMPLQWRTGLIFLLNMMLNVAKQSLNVLSKWT